MSGESQTKERLIEAAGEEFAEKGFERATVRSICDRARANLAAVNYHFGDKERLYEAALLEAHRCSRGDEEIGRDADLPPTEQLCMFIRIFLENVLSQEHQLSWHRMIMLRELIQPTSASDTVVREAIRPRFEHLKRIMRRFCPGADDRRLNALCFSVVGQIFHYKVARTFSELLVGSEGYAALDIDYLVDHISNFTLAALGQIPPLNDQGESSQSSLETNPTAQAHASLATTAQELP